MKLDDIKTISVLGAGLMGHGIAQCFLMEGYPVRLYDVQGEILEGALTRIRKNLELFHDQGLIKKRIIGPCMERLETTTDLAQAVKGSDFIVEAAPEDLALKQDLFKEIEALCPKATLIATNTSSLTLTAIGAKVKRKERLVITHWFNPPHIVPAVEVVKGEKTSDETFDLTFALLERIRKVPIKIQVELPGFLINRIQMAMMREVFDLFEKGVASPPDIDRAVKASIGFRLASIGPLLTADLGGLNLWMRVCENLFPVIAHSTEPPNALKRLTSQGHDGVKSGRGFYDYTSVDSKGAIDESIQKRDKEFLQRLKNLYWKSDKA